MKHKNKEETFSLKINVDYAINMLLYLKSSFFRQYVIIDCRLHQIGFEWLKYELSRFYRCWLTSLNAKTQISLFMECKKMKRFNPTPFCSLLCTSLPGRTHIVRKWVYLTSNLFLNKKRYAMSLFDASNNVSK